MTYLPLFLSLFAVDLLAAMSPGPNFVLVTQSAVHQSRQYSLAIVCGFVVANLAWCSAVVLGLQKLFHLQPWLYDAIRVVGGGYLILLGVQLLWTNERPVRGEQALLHRSVPSAFARGLLTNLSNPKSAIYFGGIFALFLKPGTSAWVQTVAISIVLFDTLLWYGSVALLLSAARMQRFYANTRRPIERVAGAVMTGFGARLVLSRN
jgi:threonine efflux protein